MAVYCWNCGYENPTLGIQCPNCAVIRAQVETRGAIERLGSSLAAYPLGGVGVSDITFLAQDLAAVGYDLERAIEYHISRVVDRLIQIQGIAEEILAEERKQTYYLGELLNAIRAPARTKISEQIQIAQHQADVGFQTEALQRLNEAEREFPIDPRIYLLRATIFHRQNRPNEALNEIERGVKMIIPEHPGDAHSPEHDYELRAKALLSAAQIAYQQGNPQGAVGFCRKAKMYLYQPPIRESDVNLVRKSIADGFYNEERLRNQEQFFPIHHLVWEFMTQRGLYFPTVEERIGFATYLAETGDVDEAIAGLDSILLLRSIRYLFDDPNHLTDGNIARLFAFFSGLIKQTGFERREIKRYFDEWYVKVQRTISLWGDAENALNAVLQKLPKGNVSGLVYPSDPHYSIVLELARRYSVDLGRSVSIGVGQVSEAMRKIIFEPVRLLGASPLTKKGDKMITLPVNDWLDEMHRRLTVIREEANRLLRKVSASH